MTDEDLQELLDILQGQQADTTHVEAKRAATDLPKSLRGTLSAFSNSPGGGVVILGVDEAMGFRVNGVSDPGKMQADLSSMCAEMEPPLRPVVSIHESPEGHLLVAEIAELLPSEKPCHYRGAGLANGSYIRVGDADQRMTSYEVLMLKANAGRPNDDLAPVVEGSMTDFDSTLVDELLSRVRRREPRAFQGKSTSESLRLLRAVTEYQDDLVPTLAGWLALADYPQQQYANLNVTFVHYPTPTPGALGPGGQRFIDDRSFTGPLPRLIPDVLHALRVNLTKGAFAGQTFDHWQYPEDALRECLVNAIAHRDYSRMSQGTAVQVELYPDRLLIRSPGGLFGTIRVDDLGSEGVSSTRNEALVRLLEDLPDADKGIPLCQNRGTGIPTMLAALRSANLRPPVFNDRIRGFDAVFPSESLFAPETVEWLGQYADKSLSEKHRVALAVAHAEGEVTNSILRRATGVDSRDASAILQDLADGSFLIQSGVKRWTSYRLPGSPRSQAQDRLPLTTASGVTPELPEVGDKLLQTVAIFEGSFPLTRADVQARLGLKQPTAQYRLKALVDAGYLERTAPAKSKNAAYRLTDAAKLSEAAPGAAAGAAPGGAWVRR